MTRPRSDDRAGPPAPTFRFLGSAPPPHLHWLWPQRLPLGCLSLLIGDPAIGKSLLTADLAARLSVPQPWPDNPAAERPDPATLPKLPPSPTDEDVARSYPPIRGFTAREIAPAGVVFAAPEDNDALQDRLTAAGANLLRISVIDGVRPGFTKDLLPLRLPAHADQLDQVIRAHDHPRLVVLDPIHLLLDNGVYCSPDLQTGLVACLTNIARECGVAILAVGHFSKTYARRVLYRIRSSLSLVAAARSILMLTADPDQPDRRILTQVKNAYGPPAPALAFRIVSAQTPLPPREGNRGGCSSFPLPPREGDGGGCSSSRIPPRDGPGEGRSFPGGCPSQISNPKSPSSSSVPSCLSASVPRLEWANPAQPDWRLSTGVLDLSPESFSALSETCAWLSDFLSAGPQPALELLAAARAAGISRMTLFRAKRLLNISSQKIGPTWTWLPGKGCLSG